MKNSVQHIKKNKIRKSQPIYNSQNNKQRHTKKPHPIMDVVKYNVIFVFYKITQLQPQY